MIGALCILAFLVMVGIVLYIYELWWRRRHPGEYMQKKGAAGEGAEGGKADEANIGDGERGSGSGTSDGSGATGRSGTSDGSGAIGRSETAGGDGVENGEGKAGNGQGAGNRQEQGECCGLHLVCEKDSMSPVSDEILYYDDEELDRFVGRTPDSYTPEEVEEFREVLMTLRPEDVVGWARSITQRHIDLPSDVRDELLMLVNEQRSQN